MGIPNIRGAFEADSDINTSEHLAGIYILYNARFPHFCQIQVIASAFFMGFLVASLGAKREGEKRKLPYLVYIDSMVKETLSKRYG